MTLHITGKDEMRIRDIARKANNEPSKMRALAGRMANSITHFDKAIRRARAAEDQNYHDVADIFFRRAAALR